MPAIYLALLVALFLTACDNRINLNQSPLTLLETASLQLVLNNQQAPVETPLELVLTVAIDENKTPVTITADIVGVSMYMGKIPLRFVSVTNPTKHTALYKAEFLLGACSEPNMQWQLNMHIVYSDGSTETKTSKFYSSW
ncbi:hypothetical protein [Rheinheimera sp. MMS21-TC3]|uniref:hypothetical protein n=1 Tax=Rheinheimera sp. MMS21-TC3 TaxID=3072790 RepID=UPI0028C3A884|nr:hypothetical protein [Rheinheimera sp. MMS21-TC3]WNO60977.1 hypothetical protein RDV63_08450 [Rheinheimera sp. MMS21-TC3]